MKMRLVPETATEEMQDAAIAYIRPGGQWSHIKKAHPDVAEGEMRMCGDLLREGMAAAPSAGRVSREAVERVARAMCRRDIRLRFRRNFGEEIDPDSLKVGADLWWRDHVPEAEAAIRDLDLEVEPDAATPRAGAGEEAGDATAG